MVSDEVSGGPPASPSPDQAWLAGGDAGFRTVWDQLGPLVYTFCLRSLSDKDQAADCTQETFVSAWRSRDRFDRDKGSLASWLLGIARYRVLDLYRKAPRIPTPQSAEQLGEPAADDDTAVVADRLLAAHALSFLPERARRVVELAYYSDLSQIEIAERLTLPLGTVKSDIRRGLQLMRHHLLGGDAHV